MKEGDVALELRELLEALGLYDPCERYERDEEFVRLLP